MKKDWSLARWIAVLPLLAVAFLYLAEGVTRGNFFVCTGGFDCESIPANILKVIRVDADGSRPAAQPAPSTDPDLKERAVTTQRYTARMAWFSLVEIYLLVCLAAIAIVVIQNFRHFSRRPWLWGLAILLFAGVFLVMLALPAFHMSVFIALFEHGIKPDLPGIQDVVNVLNSLGNAVTFALLLSLCAVLLPTPVEPYPAGLKQLLQKMKSSQVMLYAGTLLMVVTMLLKNATFQWALAFTSQDAAALGNARSLVAAFMTIDGTFYTLVLATAYLPVWFVLRRRAHLLADLPADEAELEKKMQEYGITFSYIKSLPRVVAIFAPFLAGPLAEVIKTLF